MLTQELSSLPTFLYSEVPFQREDSWSHSRNPYPGLLEEYTQASVTVTSIGVANEWDMDRHEQHRPGLFQAPAGKAGLKGQEAQNVSLSDLKLKWFQGKRSYLLFI